MGVLLLVTAISGHLTFSDIILLGAQILYINGPAL